MLEMSLLMKVGRPGNLGNSFELFAALDFSVGFQLRNNRNTRTLISQKSFE